MLHQMVPSSSRIQCIDHSYKNGIRIENIYDKYTNVRIVLLIVADTISLSYRAYIRRVTIIHTDGIAINSSAALGTWDGMK